MTKAINEAGYDFGDDLDDALMDLAQLGEAAAKLCNALKQTGRVVYVGCNVRPKAQKKPASPAGTGGIGGIADPTSTRAPPAAQQQPKVG